MVSKSASNQQLQSHQITEKSKYSCQKMEMLEDMNVELDNTTATKANHDLKQ